MGSAHAGAILSGLTVGSDGLVSLSALTTYVKSLPGFAQVQNALEKCLRLVESFEFYPVWGGHSSSQRFGEAEDRCMRKGDAENLDIA
eukprot:1348678-Amorphochlora_amoeboformis.AAC.1